MTTHPKEDADRCRELWGTVFERALRDARHDIPSYPTRWERRKYLKRQRAAGKHIVPYKDWRHGRQSWITNVTRRRRDVADWIEGDEFDFCCCLAGMRPGAMRRRFRMEIEEERAA